MHYAITFLGVLLKAVTAALLQLFGETYTSEAVSNVITVISVICIIVGIIKAFNEENGQELGKALLIHVGIVLVGFALLIMLIYFLIVTM